MDVALAHRLGQPARPLAGAARRLGGVAQRHHADHLAVHAGLADQLVREPVPLGVVADHEAALRCEPAPAGRPGDRPPDGDREREPEPDEADGLGADRLGEEPTREEVAHHRGEGRGPEDRRRLVERALVEHLLVALVEAVRPRDQGQQDGEREHRERELAARGPGHRQGGDRAGGEHVGDDDPEPVHPVAAAHAGRRGSLDRDPVRRGRARLLAPPGAGGRRGRRVSGCWGAGWSGVVIRGGGGSGYGQGSTRRRRGRDERDALPHHRALLPVDPSSDARAVSGRTGASTRGSEEFRGFTGQHTNGRVVAPSCPKSLIEQRPRA